MLLRLGDATYTLIVSFGLYSEQVMARYLACIELRPLPSGVWYYEDHRATFEGELGVTLYHPNPLARVRPPTRSHPSASRVIREETPLASPMSLDHGTPLADRVLSGRAPTQSDEVEEDPEEAESE
ncbi:hypothetical protein RIF29_29916 [Crotalaria pallida]|uniref:Uncharacterized protein n=1 Tax=Crotalaria pallida TaxID=3830 RepID=A0AAN9I0U5_CROPI